MIQIVKMVRTCHACPAQWDGWDDQGTYYYFRYRWGHLSVNKDDVFGEELFAEDLFDEDDGWLTYAQLKDILKDLIHFPASELRED